MTHPLPPLPLGKGQGEGSPTTRSCPVALTRSRGERENRLGTAPVASWSWIGEDGFDFQVGNHLFDARHGLRDVNDLIFQLPGVDEPGHPDDTIISPYIHIDPAGNRVGRQQSPD